MRISRALLDEVIAHAREEAPNECCGLIASRDGVAVSVRRVRNIHASPLKFEMDHMEQYHATTEIEDAGLEQDEPDVRAWKIVDGTVSEAALEVEDGAEVDA